MKLTKKGQAAEDLIFLVAFIFMLAIGGIIATYAFGQVVNKFHDTPSINESTNAMYAIDSINTTNSYWDYLILVVMIGFTVAMIILGYFLDTHPVFIVIYILGLIIGVVFTYIMKYVFEQFAVKSEMIATINSSFPITTHIFNYLPIYFVVIGCLSMVATYAKSQTTI